ncbi:cell surface glycoprotein 1-like isoform X1 [Tetranychus urticae]|uniref:cell surface glycoprotein 1-like isoform X1 n=1 Tax=Tetranychus urticae TaxID=32264 RepID=UPI00077BEB57|nr:cell surface glycoprotein 1-like isoform X1 [Tetranychus urticae]
MFMKKYSFQSTVINFNDEEDESDWQSVMAKCLGARHLAMLPQIPDITMSDAGEPSGIFSSMEDPEIGRDMGSICHPANSPILPKTIIERVPNSPVSSPFPSPYPSPFPSPSPASTESSPQKSSTGSPQVSPQPSPRLSSRKSLRDSIQPSFTASPQPSPRLSSRKSLRDSIQPSFTASPQPTPKLSSRKSLRDSIQPSFTASPQTSPKLSSRKSLRDSIQPSFTASPQTSPRLSRRKSLRDSIQPSFTASPQPSPRLSSRKSLRDSIQPSPRASPQPSPRASPQPSPQASPEPSPRRNLSTKSNAGVRPKRFLKGKRVERWRGQHPIYKPLENGCFEVLGLTHAKTPDVKKRKLTRVKKEMKVATKENRCNLSESFVGKSVSTRSKNADLIKSFENLQWKKSKGSDSIELASLFRDKTNGLASGFFRMNGVCEKPSQKTANYKTIYTLLKGSVAFKIADEPYMVLNEFESVTIPELTGYAIKNLSDDESVLYFNVYQH